MFFWCKFKSINKEGEFAFWDVVEIAKRLASVKFAEYGYDPFYNYSSAHSLSERENSLWEIDESESECESMSRWYTE